ncbi:MAG: T9SS type A sorting domain-containing protein [Candidatus Cloacimonetes bacterium]|nr:T9SS type A sorting domain-containing protein [Candidatus Cloacimonadota bacterium]
MSKLNLVLTVIILPVLLLGITIEVPGDYSTIQAAINACSDGDIIEVSAGIWQENVEIPDKSITLRGVGGVKETIIDGSEDDGSAIAILSDTNYDDDFVIEGFTIKGGTGRESVHFGGGIMCEGENGVLRDLLIYGNNANVNGKGGGVYLSRTETIIENCTIADNYAEIGGGGLYLDDYCTITLRNSIVYHNTKDSSSKTPVYENIYIDNSSNSLAITYTMLHEGIDDINNNGGTITSSNITEEDPFFCFYYDEDDEIDLKYCIIETSICIDGGNPDLIYNDTDGTRNDMGAVETTYDVKECEGDHWNWESFPRVGSSVNDIYDTVTHILDMDDLYPIYSTDPGMQVSADGYPYFSAYNALYWSPNYNLYSAVGYKVYRDDEADFYVPLEGYRLSNTYQFSFTADDEKWLGYWIPETRNIVDAFNDLWSHVKTIEAEDWYYQRPTGGFGTPSSSTTGKNLEYGKMYIITMDISTTYTWDASGGGRIEKSSEKAETEYFTYEDQPDYLAIDILDISENVDEIGVFQGTTCIGASVVDSSSVQILAYIDPDLRDMDELTIQFVTQRGTQNNSELCWVYNEESGEFRKDRIRPAGQKYILLSLQESYPNMENPIPGCHLYQNYPNPFNPETNIKFYLSSETSGCSLSIFNIRGQKVRNYDLNSLTGGCEHTVVWDGIDDQGKKVSSGFYFYQLSSDQGSVSHKMLMMK